jgi:hypothetical protein
MQLGMLKFLRCIFPSFWKNLKNSLHFFKTVSWAPGPWASCSLQNAKLCIFCLKFFLWIFKIIYANIYGYYEHIQSPPTPSRKILIDALKIHQNGGKAEEITPKFRVGRSDRVLSLCSTPLPTTFAPWLLPVPIICLEGGGVNWPILY